jgi:hypothetical protein
VPTNLVVHTPITFPRGIVGIIAAGTVVGLVLALTATRALASFLDTMAETTRTTTSDPLLLLRAPALLAGIALAGCYFPARHSTDINPATALRAFCRVT